MSFFDSMFDYLKVPLIDVQNATNDFADEKFIREEGSGKEYKGRLVLSSGKSLDIVARRLDPELRGRRRKEFKTEIMMLASLNHQNVVSIVGFCNENKENIIITKLEAKGSLDEYISDPITLPWTQRLKICLGIARALSYIHYDQGRTFSVIHRDIKSSKILLDDKWEAKLSGFEFSTKKLAAQRHGLVLDKPYGTPGYMDPAYVRTESVSHKSDMYSLGVVLFEVLTGRKAFSQDNEKGESLAELAKSHYENETLNDIIHPGLQNQINSKTLKIFSEAAYRCLNEQRAQRPSIDKAIFALDQALKSQLATENSVSTLFSFSLIFFYHPLILI
ncbi:putative protein kinase RLK-Pelle-CrRLK1L-1 family [Helianthus annuus]|nr:putative protein kinase RLK-Pelle-CrRLK1L-1 family [Helianthus annuus]